MPIGYFCRSARRGSFLSVTAQQYVETLSCVSSKYHYELSLSDTSLLMIQFVRVQTNLKQPWLPVFLLA